MTVCIAAECTHNGEPRIVLCSDWKGETALGGSETTDKLRVLPKGWVALIADTLSRAEELVAQYESHFERLAAFTDDRHLYEEMKKPAQALKAMLANDYVQQTMGMSYTDFLTRAEHLPKEFVTQRLMEVSEIKLHASLILAGFVGGKNREIEREKTEPYLIVVEDTESHEDVVRVEESFAVIGSGAYVAIPVFHQREHQPEKSLMETIYTVYEAKTLSEVVPGVGKTTSIDVMEPDGSIWCLSDAGHDRCQELFGQLGPKLGVSLLSEDKRERKRAETYFELKAEFLEPFDEEEKEEGKPQAAGAGE